MDVRSLFLLVVGISFWLTSAAGLILPQFLTDMVGMNLVESATFSEIRSNYGGMHMMLGGFILWAALSKKQQSVALLLTALFTGGYVFGRMISLVIDGLPNLFVYAVTVGELVAASFALFFLKPSWNEIVEPASS